MCTVRGEAGKETWEVVDINRGRSRVHLISFAIAAAVLVASVWNGPMPAIGATVRQKQLELSALKTELKKTRTAADGAASDYQQSYDLLQQIEAQLTANQAELLRAQGERDRYKLIFNDRLDSIYRHGYVSIAEVLLGSTTFRDFLDRLDLMSRVNEQDAQLFANMARVTNELQNVNAVLTAKKTQREQVLQQIAAQQQALAEQLGRLTQLYRENKTQLAVLIRQEAAARAAAMANLGPNAINGFQFPLRPNVGYSYGNDWHEPRVGHLHQGTDIFADKGSVAVACATGTARVKYYNGNAGNSFYINADNGVEYKYFHMKGFIVTGGRVTPGQPVAYVGDTGNAQGTPPHIHFEVHPGGGAAVNPYPILKASDPLPPH